MNSKSGIDFVLLWVDPSDVEWLKERKTASLTNEKLKQIVPNDYRDWDLLKYWFRAVEKYSPWVDKIHFVTYGHLPDFLNINHPKLNIVNHKDFIPKEYLPTFSSHTIELNIHRIKDLSDKFVYFNDDTFLNSVVTPDFFFKNNLPLDTAIINPVAPSRYDAISTLMINNIGTINQNFDKRKVMRANRRKWFNLKYGKLNILNFLFTPWAKFPGLYEQHLPTNFLKSSFEAVWDAEFEILHNTCLNQVRDFKTDVNQWLIKEWQIVQGNFLPRKTNVGDRFLIDSLDEALRAASELRKNKLKLICLNDHFHEGNLKDVVKVLKDGFDNSLFEKSNYEL